MINRAAIAKLFSTFQLTRLTHAFAGVANLWFVVLWTRGLLDRGENIEHYPAFLQNAPLGVLLFFSAVLGVGLSAYGGALNDVFDARRDHTFAPDRPIPSGRMSTQTAALIGFASLLCAMLAGALLSPNVLYMVLLCAALILFYNTLARHIPGLGLVTIGAIYGAHMLIMNLGLLFIWPVLLVMIHAIVIHAVVHHLEHKRPRMTPLAYIGVGIGSIGLIILLWYQTGIYGPLFGKAYTWYGLAWPVAAVIAFITSSVHKTRFASSKSFAAEKLQRYGSLWMGVYGVAWLLGGALYNGALIIGALVVAAIVWMMLVRDLGAWIEQPIGYKW